MFSLDPVGKCSSLAWGASSLGSRAPCPILLPPPLLHTDLCVYVCTRMLSAAFLPLVPSVQGRLI